ncbi:hypothetical protein NB688_002856 [Xanthomonas sacchari]|uniref:Uncharacterized protein n=1 Tax=Xanthomonas sacchari TaxID=56458 RepID=A0ABT3DXT8_9XANT|nr:hypothetical protein [Xanthomonas sacchari]MCW0399805.1 hypothetical protein [Xanthomonas sacchari]MCW0420690.1 hypothetical protein [Xanthomonas sacchari]UYK74735.1 hypothetical protein NG828_10705 [Xanthomonas sacchari]
MAVFVPACLERDLDAQTGTCSAPIWIPQPSLLPELTVADAQSIGQAIALLWAVAYAFRLVRKKIQQS